MTLETVKATYDPDTKKVYVKLSSKAIDYSIPMENVLTYFDYDKYNQIVGVEVILP